MFIIQTNRSDTDFQSGMYEIKNQTWEDFKGYILSNEQFTNKIVEGTKYGATKPNDCIVSELNINDDTHLRVLIGLKNGNQIVSEYTLVKNDEFKKLLK